MDAPCPLPSLAASSANATAVVRRPRGDYVDSAPLLEIAERRARAANHDPARPDWLGVDVAGVLGTSKRQVARWRAGARIQWINADRLAVRLGMHPLEIWPEWWPVEEAS